MHYGIKNQTTGAWLRFDNGAIFWTTSHEVAYQQCLACGFDGASGWVIAPFGN
jgi:hypothetical protein